MLIGAPAGAPISFERALESPIPSIEELPYTIRLVSETLESNGSSSMGSVCRKWGS